LLPTIEGVTWWRREYFWPSALVVVGVYFLLNNLGYLWWLRPEIAWPLVLIGVGVWLIVRRART
jgi:cell wall-active antibiotic response 4TMS protein YvqF